MRLLVTGGAGSLGSNLIERIGMKCEEILVIDNFATGKRASLPPLPNLRVVEGGIEDGALVEKEFQQFRPTHVVHSAASYKNPNDWETDAKVNVIGTINVVRSSEAVGVKRFINFQTALCYGRPTKVPIPIDHRCAPFTSYGISKTAGESVVAASSMSWASLRLANVTGPRLAIGPIPAFYKKLKADEPCTVSTTVRDFLDMSDFISLMELIMGRDDVGCFNVSTGAGHSIAEIFHLVAAHLGKPDVQPASVVEPGADDVSAVVLDPSHTEQTFDWKATRNFEQTITDMLLWYDAHGITDVYSHLQGRS
jgi:nucleoside-diphosphate-sugar epimerase